MIESGKIFEASFYTHLTQFWAYPIYNKGLDYSNILAGDYKNCNFPIVFLSKDEEYVKNKRKTDFLSTGGLTNEYVATEKVIDILSTNNITGWKTYPVEVYDKNENYIGGYYGLSITGRCKAVKPSLAEPWVDSYGEEMLIGLPLNLDTWDGADMFLLQGISCVFFTKKAVTAIKRNKLTNIYFKDISERKVHLYGGKPFWENNEEVKILE